MSNNDDVNLLKFVLELVIVYLYPAASSSIHVWELFTISKILYWVACGTTCSV